MATRAFSSNGRDIADAGIATETLAARAACGLEVQKTARGAASAGLLAALAAGSVALWTAVPAGVLWLVSRLNASSGTMTAGTSLAVAFAIPAAIVLAAQGLVRVERVYVRVTGATASAPRVHGWRRSLSDSGASAPATVLERMMAVSVLLALVGFVIWFFAFAGSSLPA
jgi:hypothetical protein